MSASESGDEELCSELSMKSGTDSGKAGESSMSASKSGDEELCSELTKAQEKKRS